MFGDFYHKFNHLDLLPLEISNSHGRGFNTSALREDSSAMRCEEVCTGDRRNKNILCFVISHLLQCVCRGLIAFSFQPDTVIRLVIMLSRGV